MWLEEMAWLWLPVAGGLGLWVVWNTLALKAEVRALRQRLEQLQAKSSHTTLAHWYHV
jgi:hypothetical protein